jgi:hypothetical protein
MVEPMVSWSVVARPGASDLQRLLTQALLGDGWEEWAPDEDFVGGEPDGDFVGGEVYLRKDLHGFQASIHTMDANAQGLDLPPGSMIIDGWVDWRFCDENR